MSSTLPFQIKTTFSSSGKLSQISLIQGMPVESESYYSALIKDCLTKAPALELLDVLDRTGFTPFQNLVYEGLLSVKAGETISYAGLAEKIGRPKAARAVGTALGKNPFLIVIPCHRVIRENGELGGFAAGLEIKRLLLSLENNDRSKHS